MYNVLMFGTGDGYFKMKRYINPNMINILDFIDNDKKKVGNILEGKIIISPKEILRYNYDYIIIASSFYKEIEEQLLSFNIEKGKVLSFYRYYNDLSLKYSRDIDSKFSYNFLKDNLKELNQSNNYDGFITGLSYAFYGINTKLLKNKCINLSLSGQDLFYDYHITKQILKTNNKFKYAIISLSYYSFHYDLSKSINSDRCKIVYNPIINELHNFQENHQCNCAIERILKDNHLNYMAKNSTSPCIYSRWEKSKFNEYSISIRKKLGKQRAIKDSSKDYPKTVNENIRILDKYLELLLNYNILPIIVVLPVTKWYSREFKSLMKREFYKVIDEIKKKYEIVYLDFFHSELFKDEDFFDESHLNKDGARKLTLILNEYIV